MRLEPVPPNVARVVMAVVNGARSTDEVRKACGWASTQTAHRYLHEAHDLGLIFWEPEKDGTLRPALTVIASSYGR